MDEAWFRSQGYFLSDGVPCFVLATDEELLAVFPHWRRRALLDAPARRTITNPFTGKEQEIVSWFPEPDGTLVEPETFVPDLARLRRTSRVPVGWTDVSDFIPSSVGADEEEPNLDPSRVENARAELEVFPFERPVVSSWMIVGLSAREMAALEVAERPGDAIRAATFDAVRKLLATRRPGQRLLLVERVPRGA